MPGVVVLLVDGSIGCLVSHSGPVIVNGYVACSHQRMIEKYHMNPVYRKLVCAGITALAMGNGMPVKGKAPVKRR